MLNFMAIVYMYWLPKLHKRPYMSRFIANSSSCTTTQLSILLTSCLTAIKNHVIKYCPKVSVYERNGKNLFCSIKNSGEILNKLKSRGFLASNLSTYDFSTLYTTLHHNLIKEKITELIEQTFNRQGSLYLACNNKNAFFLLLNNLNDINCGHVRKCVMLSIFFGQYIYKILTRNYIDKLQIFQWVLIVLVLLQICFCFVMRETSYCLCQTIIKLTFLKLLTPPPEIYMTYLILISLF